jgi:hypothetical protein
MIIACKSPDCKPAELFLPKKNVNSIPSATKFALFSSKVLWTLNRSKQLFNLNPLYFKERLRYNFQNFMQKRSYAVGQEIGVSV